MQNQLDLFSGASRHHLPYTGNMAGCIDVVAAVIRRGGKVLICQRRRGGRHPLKWEFPGGKVEPEEDPRAALERELREELGVEARAGEMLDAYEVRYENGPLTELQFYRVTDFAGEPRNLDFEQIVWEQPE